MKSAIIIIINDDELWDRCLISWTSKILKKKFDATAEKKIIHCFSTFDFFFPICNCKCLVWTELTKKSNLWDLWYKFMMLKRKKNMKDYKKKTWLFRSKKKRKENYDKKTNLYYYSTPSVTQIFVLLHPSLANTVFDQCDYVIKSRKRDWLG